MASAQRKALETTKLGCLRRMVRTKVSDWCRAARVASVSYQGTDTPAGGIKKLERLGDPSLPLVATVTSPSREFDRALRCSENGDRSSLIASACHIAGSL